MSASGSEKKAEDGQEQAPDQTAMPAPGSTDDLRDQVIETIKTVFDPEIPVNIYELGLIYKVEVNEARDVQIDMTLTSPNCPAAQSMPAEVEQKTRSLAGIGEVTVDVVWDPPWGPEHMSEAARLELGVM